MVWLGDESGCDGEFASKLDANWHVSSMNGLLNSRRDTTSQTVTQTRGVNLAAVVIKTQEFTLIAFLVSGLPFNLPEWGRRTQWPTRVSRELSRTLVCIVSIFSTLAHPVERDDGLYKMTAMRHKRGE